jgi:hypothetical protein
MFRANRMNEQKSFPQTRNPIIFENWVTRQEITPNEIEQYLQSHEKSFCLLVAEFLLEGGKLPADSAGEMFIKNKKYSDDQRFFSLSCLYRTENGMEYQIEIQGIYDVEKKIGGLYVVKLDQKNSGETMRFPVILDRQQQITFRSGVRGSGQIEEEMAVEVYVRSRREH